MSGVIAGLNHLCVLHLYNWFCLKVVLYGCASSDAFCMVLIINGMKVNFKIKKNGHRQITNVLDSFYISR